MYEKIIHNTEELNAMAAHLRMSQNFSELKELAARWLVPESDVSDFISGKRYQLAEIPLAEREYASAAVKIREEMWLLKDQLFTDKVALYLIKKSEEDMLFACRVLEKQKTLQKCMNYIMGKAYEIAEKEYEKKFGEKPGSNSRPSRQKKEGIQNRTISMGMSETKVYEWAQEYYALDDAAKEAKAQDKEMRQRLRALKKKEEQKRKADSQKDASKTPAKSGREMSVKEKGEETDSVYLPEKEKKDTKEKEASLESIQLSLFDLQKEPEAKKEG